MYYIMLILSSFLFSCGFLYNKLYKKNSKSGIKTTFYLVLFTATITCASMFATLFLKGESFSITHFSLLMAAVYALNNFISTYVAIKAFEYADLSVFSIFMMMGSIVLPSLFGFLLYGEEISLLKWVAFIFIFAALYFNVVKLDGNKNKKATLYYLLVFTLNGTAGIISKIHQSASETLRVNTQSFLSTSAMMRIVVSIVILLILNAKDKQKVINVKSVIFGCASGLFNAVGNYFNLFVLIFIPVTVHSVVTTGGVLIFSAILGLFYKEKITKRITLSLIFALVATVLVSLEIQNMPSLSLNDICSFVNSVF